jgi:hypothetical protein
MRPLERFPATNQMKVSVAWIGILLIVSVLVYFTVYGYHVWEMFQNPPPAEERVLEEGFIGEPPSELGLNITMCPANSKSYLDTSGRTVCCMGDVASDTCKGETICSLSEGMASLPTCTKWFETYLKEKGRGRCPRSMPIYFESADGKVRGCTDGRLNKTGSGAATDTQKKCFLYQTKQQDNNDLQSCTNVKRLESAVCFPNSSLQHSKQLTSFWDNYPPVVSCSYRSDGMFPQNCFETKTVLEYIQAAFAAYPPSNYSAIQWQKDVNNAPPYFKMFFCPISEKVNITKSVAFDNLKNEKVYPNV